MLELKTPGEIAAMDVTGRFIAALLDGLTGRTRPGVNLLDLEQRARDMIAERGAVSCYWDYAPSFGSGPFRNVICLSVNDAVLHGLPHDYVLRDGDLLSMDIAVSIDGWVADSARSIIVGAERPEDRHLVEATEVAPAAAIAAALPGNRLGDISAAIGAVAAEYGYEDPHVANAGRKGRGLVLRPGLDARPRAMVRGGDGQDRLRPRRLDHPLRRRLAHRAQRTHDRDHRG